MKTFRKVDKKFLGEYEFMITYDIDCILSVKKQEKWRNKEDRLYCQEIELFLNHIGKGQWTRHLNRFFLSHIDDAIWLKLNFSEKLNTIARYEKKI